MGKWLSQKGINSRQSILLFALAFGVALCLAAANLSLWLDELLQLVATRNLHTKALLTFVADNAGGVPFGYLIQAYCLQAIGFSMFAARLPSIIFGVLSCLGVAALGSIMPLRWRAFSMICFALLPLHFRYGFEARPYEEALCCSIWATVLFLKFDSTSGFSTFAGYLIAALAGVYTQPFSLFVILAHAIWAAFVWMSDRTRESAQKVFVSAAAVLLTGLLFLPWYLFAKSRWHESISAAGTGSGLSPKTPLLILREITGAGFPGTILLGVFIVFGLMAVSISRKTKVFWVLQILVPVVLTLVGDAFFGYFFAIRQLIFVLPAAVILASFGFEVQLARHRRSALALATLFLLVSLYSDVHFLFRPREDWKKTADFISSELKPGECYTAVPQGASSFLEFFQPSLTKHECGGGEITDTAVTVAISPYATLKEIKQSRRHLLGDHFSLMLSIRGLTPYVQVWRKQAPKH